MCFLTRLRQSLFEIYREATFQQGFMRVGAWFPPLAEELLFIEKYIELQKIRTANPNAIKLIVEGEVGDNTIPPLLFIPIIENAFTHTLLSRDGNSIYIYFMIDGNNIQFVCKNYFDKTLPKSKFY